MENFSNNDFDESNLDSQDTETWNTETPNNDIPNNETENNDTNIGGETSYIPNHRPPINVFAFFARSLGIFAIFCAIFGIFFGSFICGGMAIILAVLSKGYRTKMEKNAIIGITTGCIAVVLQIFSLAFSVYNIINVPEYRELFNSMYEQMYGEPIDESITDMLDELGGFPQEGDL